MPLVVNAFDSLSAREFDLPLTLIPVLTKQNRQVADHPDQFTPRPLRKLAGEILLAVLEIDKPDLDQFMRADRLGDRPDKGVRHPVFPDKHRRLQMMSLFS